MIREIIPELPFCSDVTMKVVSQSSVCLDVTTEVVYKFPICPETIGEIVPEFPVCSDLRPETNHLTMSTCVRAWKILKATARGSPGKHG